MRYGIQTLGPKFFGGAPDIAVAGPNVGSNLGITVLVSGTVGAATEAVKEGTFIPVLSTSNICAHTLNRHSRHCIFWCLWLTDCVERSHTRLQYCIRPTRHPVHIRRTQCWPKTPLANQRVHQRQLFSFEQHVLLFGCRLPLRALKNLSCDTAIDAERRGDVWQRWAFTDRKYCDWRKRMFC